MIGKKVEELRRQDVYQRLQVFRRFEEDTADYDRNTVVRLFRYFGSNVARIVPSLWDMSDVTSEGDSKSSTYCKTMTSTQSVHPPPST